MVNEENEEDEESDDEEDGLWAKNWTNYELLLIDVYWLYELYT